MNYGYGRVSTKRQAKDGNSLEAQEQILKANGAEELFFDAYTGKKMDRPNFDELQQKLQPGDKLIITKLDRFARSTIEGVKLISELLEQDITIHIVTMGIIDNSPTGKLIYTVLLAVAEFERDMIVERTQEGKRIAKQKPNYRDGRPKKYSRAQIVHAMQLLENHSYMQVAEMTGISKATLYREHVKYVPKPVIDENVLPGQINLDDYLEEQNELQMQMM